MFASCRGRPHPQVQGGFQQLEDARRCLLGIPSRPGVPRPLLGEIVQYFLDKVFVDAAGLIALISNHKGVDVNVEGFRHLRIVSPPSGCHSKGKMVKYCMLSPLFLPEAPIRAFHWTDRGARPMTAT